MFKRIFYKTISLGEDAISGGDKNKIDNIRTSDFRDTEETAKEIKPTETSIEYQDSFKEEPDPADELHSFDSDGFGVVNGSHVVSFTSTFGNEDPKTDNGQGFLYGEDPLNTIKEFEQEARSAMTTHGTTDVSEAYDYATSHNRSKNALSYFPSEDYFDGQSRYRPLHSTSGGRSVCELIGGDYKRRTLGLSTKSGMSYTVRKAIPDIIIKDIQDVEPTIEDILGTGYDVIGDYEDLEI